MILGRSKALWLALVAAVLNAGVWILGWTLTVDQLAALNALALSIIGVIANESDPTTAGTFALTMKAPSLR